MNQQVTAAVPATFQINGKTITETAVHIYATVRMRVALPPTENLKDAIEKATEQTDLEYAIRHGEYADEITGYLVDQISGEPDNCNYESETPMTPEGFVDRRSLEQGQFIVLSTAHLTQDDVEVLEGMNLAKAPVMIAATGHGWIFSLMPAADADVERLGEDLYAEGLSDAFVCLWKGMRERGYGLLQLDADAAAHPEFATFEG